MQALSEILKSFWCPGALARGQNSSADLLINRKSFDGSCGHEFIPYVHKFIRIIIRHIIPQELRIIYSTIRIYREKSAFFF